MRHGAPYRVFAHREPLDADDVEIDDADEREHRPQIGFLKFERHHRALRIDAAARDHDDSLLALDEPYGPALGIAERAAEPDDMIDPCLQRGGHAKVVHRHGEHDDV